MEQFGNRKQSKSKDSNLKSEWALFGNIVFSPIILILIIFIFILIVASIKVDKSGANSQILLAILTVIISISSGVVGSFITAKWSRFSEKGILFTKGRSAVRGLKVLSQSIKHLENVLLAYKNKNPEEIKAHIDSLIGYCDGFQLHVFNSMEEWVDIVPEANIKKLIFESLVNFSKEKTDLEKQLYKLKEESQNSDEQKTEEIENLTQQLQKRNEVINRLAIELTTLQLPALALDTQNFWGLDAMSSNPSFDADRNTNILVNLVKAINNPMQCPNCGAGFEKRAEEKCTDCGHTWALNSLTD